MSWGQLGPPTDKKLSSVNSYRQDLLPTCKAFPKETTTLFVLVTASYHMSPCAAAMLLAAH